MFIISDNVAENCFFLSVAAFLDFSLMDKGKKWKQFLFVQLGYIDVRNHHQSKSTWTWHRILLCYIATCTKTPHLSYLLSVKHYICHISPLSKTPYLSYIASPFYILSNLFRIFHVYNYIYYYYNIIIYPGRYIVRIIVHSHYRSTAHHWRAINGHFMNSLIETPGAINSSMTINTFQYQQTRDVDSMMVYCWASVADGQPTSKQHRVNVCVFCGNVIPHNVHPKPSMLYHTMYILSHQCYTTRCES